MMSHPCLLGPSPSFRLLGFAPDCVALGCVWLGAALHTPQASQPDTRPSPWAVLEDCDVCGCGHAHVRGPASPCPPRPPPAPGTAEQWQMALAAYLLAFCCPRDPVQDLRRPHEAPGTLCPVCLFSLSSAASSPCVPADCSFPRSLVPSFPRRVFQ